MKNLITKENVSDVIKEIEDAFFDIPFENSAYQTERFVINAALTPERAYRAIGLRMMNRLRALQEARFTRMREDIDIEEAEHELKELSRLINTDTREFKIRRLQIDIEEKKSRRRFTDKLINDAITELNVLYSHFKRLPKFTKDEFEAGEAHYFKESLERQLKGIVGAAESLSCVNNELPSLTFNTERIKDGR